MWIDSIMSRIKKAKEYVAFKSVYPLIVDMQYPKSCSYGKIQKDKEFKYVLKSNMSCMKKAKAYQGIQA